MRTQAQTVAGWFGVPSVEVFMTRQAPQLCLPIAGSPLQIVLGTALMDLSEPARQFLLARSIAIARSHLTATVRLDGAEMRLVSASLLHAFDPPESPSSGTPKDIETNGQRLAKLLANTEQK